MPETDDIEQLIYDDIRNEQIISEKTSQIINTDPEFDQVVYGYRKSRWRTNVTYILSVLAGGLPFLVFHWLPHWFLYVASERCCFQLAHKVLVLETYQKKCKSYFIHKILTKDIANTSGLTNEGFSPEVGEKEPIVTAEDLNTPIYLEDGTKHNLQRYRYFEHKKQVLIWNAISCSFSKLVTPECSATCAMLRARANTAPSPDTRNRMLNIYGLNEIKVPIQSYMTLILLEVFNPFYVFQLFTIAVWLAEEYYYYCVAVVMMSTFGVATSVIQTKKNQDSLRATVEAHDNIQLWDGRQVESQFVAPGDVVLLKSEGQIMHFDAVLLTGSAIVNESMLTGESVPVTKTALMNIDTQFDFKEHAHNTLFSGTRVIQTRYFNNEPVKALVLRTGYDTTKGQLVRSILYPVPFDYKFDRDSYKFILILAGIAAVGLAYTIGLKASRSFDPGDVIIKALDIITIVIPPALPAAMTVGRLAAVSRLRKARISCLNTRAVTVGGSLDCICFDKTGTLTEDGLDMWGVVAVSQATTPPLLGRPLRDPSQLNELHHLKIGMATCHSLTLLNGELAGDPLDSKMFESTLWTLEEPDVPESTNYEVLTPTIVRPKKTSNINVDDVNLPLEVGIVLKNQFMSSLQRSSVVVRVLGEDVLRVYCKGAPEMIATLCKPETVPADLSEVLSSHAEKGFRVIAMATKMMEATYKELQKMTRDIVECDMEFLGLIIMENRLKAATTGIIRELKEAEINVVMITGDNVHTAVSVAKECGILSAGERVVYLQTDTSGNTPKVLCHSAQNGANIGKSTSLDRLWQSLDSGHGTIDSCHSRAQTGVDDLETGRSDVNYKIVLTGDTWKVLRENYSGLIGRIIERGAVFARMSSDQKQQLIIELKALGYYVGMCGDGANDCGALKAAHTGVSLSELESSVAAPFTSADPDIVCVSRVLREGRAALTTSFGVFKFMVAYSLTEFFSVAFLYYFDSNLTDFQFLFIDVALIVNFAFFFGMTDAYTGKLSKIPPLTSLLSVSPLFSLMGHMLLIATAQYLSYYALTMFPWYVRHVYIGDNQHECWENYAVYAVSMFQYIIVAIAFSHGSPYRKSIVTNKKLMISILIMTGICIYIAVMPAEWLAGFLQLRMPLDVLMAYIVLALASFNLVLALFYERFVIQYLFQRKQMIPKFLKERRVAKTPHLMIKRQLTNMDYLEYSSVLQHSKESCTNMMASSIENSR